MLAEKAAPSSSKIKFDESDDESSSGDDGKIERELADVTFGDLQKARADGSHSVFRKQPEAKVGRANKNRPMEASAKRPVGRYREIIQVPKKEVRDPRFESLCGELDMNRFKKKYKFVYENNLPAEREDFKRQMKKSKDPEVISELKSCISTIDRQLKSASKRTDRDILAEHRKRERELAKQGKKPFYLKKSEIRKEELRQKYEELNASGKVESFIEKKRRKKASKDHRYVPYRRTGTNE